VTPARRLVALPQHLLVYDRNSGAPENPLHMSWVMLWQLQHRTFANPIWHWDTLGDNEYFGKNMRHGSLIGGKHAACTGIWSKFSCTGKTGVHISMTNRSLHIAQSQWQLSQSRRYCVLLSEYNTLAHLFVAKLQLLLAYHWSSGTFKIRIAECWILRHGSGIQG